MGDLLSSSKCLGVAVSGHSKSFVFFSVSYPGGSELDPCTEQGPGVQSPIVVIFSVSSRKVLTLVDAALFADIAVAAAVVVVFTWSRVSFRVLVVDLLGVFLFSSFARGLQYQHRGNLIYLQGCWPMYVRGLVSSSVTSMLLVGFEVSMFNISGR